MPKVSMRDGFSDRNLIKPENKEIQIRELDNRTRTQLVNKINELYCWVYGNDFYKNRGHIQEFFRYLLSTVYSIQVDYRSEYNERQVLGIINGTIINDDYDDVLTLIEAIIRYWDSYLKKARGLSYYSNSDKTYRSDSIFEILNNFFKREYIGYRFIDGIIDCISDEFEISAIIDALSNKNLIVKEHISKANKLLSDRDNPDYENSIKESISGVEAVCELLTGLKGKSATLGNMLNDFEKKGVVIHEGLKSAFKTLYGYTSDANGIRHAGDIGGPSATFEEAKFMLVACCAFINYLMAVNAD